jgi:hypothetical protein
MSPLSTPTWFSIATLRTTEKQFLSRLRAAKLDVHGVEDYRISARLPPTRVLGFAAFNSTELKRATGPLSRAIERLSPDSEP